MTTLVGALLLLLTTEVMCEVCDENVINRRITSDYELIEALQEMQTSSLQNTCYSLLFDADAIMELTLNETFAISTNALLQGNNTTIKCNISASYNYAGIISVNNVEKFSITGMSFIACPSTFVRFENVSDITILQSSFSDFTEVPIYLFNCPSLSVINCTFINNTASAKYLFRSYEGNAGSLSYGWNNLLLDHQSTATVRIYNCTFYKNSARGRVRDFNPSTDALEARTFTGRGGGVALVFNATSNVTVTIEHTRFEENFANGFGGGLFILIDGISVNQYFNIYNNMFLSNTARFGGAAIFFGYLSSISDTDISTIAIKDCWFVRNRRGFVGAVSFALTYTSGLTNFLQINNSRFHYNEAEEYGAAVGLFHANFLSPKTDVSPLEIIECEFVGNTGGRGGILSIAYFPISFYGNVKFINNSGPAFRVVGSAVNVRGAHLTFMGNNAGGSAGGAMYLTSYTQVILSEGSTFDFINNIGSIGASLVVETQAVPSLFSRNYYNRLCFLQFDQQIENTLLPEDWTEVNFNFEGNSAIVGSALFIDRLSLCSWNSATHPYFFLNETLRWSFMHYGSSNENLGHGTYDNVSLDLQTPAVYFSLNHSSAVSSYPGQDKLLEVTAYDELSRSTAAIFRYGSTEDTTKGNTIQFNPSAHLYQPADAGVTLHYSLNSLDNNNASFTVQVTSDTVNESSEELFELYLKDCLPGYSLQNTSNGFVCLCDDGVLIEACIENKIILKYGLWAHYTGSELFTYQCPPGYCRCSYENNFGEHTCLSVYRNDNEDLQCDCNREGLLCGSCKEGRGISTLLNSCVSCIHVGWLLIMLLVILDATVAALIIIFSIRIPSWMLPFLYYIQITPYIMENLNYSFSEWHRYLYYLSSGLSLYFPYDFCLFDEMDAVTSYGLRYIPIMTTGIVVMVLFTIYKIFLKRKWRFSWNGVWTLLILQYSHVVYTSLSILNCPTIPLYQGDGSGKWFIDATYQCFHGAHTIIGTIAIIIVILSVLFIPFIGLACNEVILKFTLRNFTDAVNNSIDVQYKWWSSIELSRRLLIIAIILPFPGNNVPPLLMIMLIFALYTYFLSNDDLKMSFSNLCFEAVLLGNITIMLMLKTTNYIKESLDETVEPISNEGCQNNQVLTELTLLLLVLYYLPVLIAVVYYAIRVSKKHVHWIHMRILKRKLITDEVCIPIELQQPSRVGSFYVIVENDGTVTMSH